MRAYIVHSMEFKTINNFMRHSGYIIRCIDWECHKRTSSDIVESVDDSSETSEEVFVVNFFRFFTYSVFMRLYMHCRVHLFHRLSRRRRLRSLLARSLKKLKPYKFFMGKPSQNYRVSLASWDLTMLLATRHKRTQPALTPAKAGTRFTTQDGWKAELTFNLH